MAGQKTVVFDLGRVLIDYDYTRLFGFFAERGLPFADEQDFLGRTRLVDFECGRIDADGFFDHLGALLPDRPDQATLLERWLDIFTPMDRMLAFAADLGRQAPVYALSNICSVHLAYLKQAHGIHRIARGILPSYEAGCMKPDPRIYRLAEQRFGLDPAATLFVDDLAENVAGARACGWSAVQHRDPELTRAAVTDWLAETPGAT